MSLATPIVLADGLDLTLYSAVADVWFDTEPRFIEQDYRLYDATGRRLELFIGDDEYLVRPLEDMPTGAGELAGLLRLWLPLAGVALLVVTAVVLAAAIRAAAAGTEETVLQVIQVLAGGAAVAVLLAAAVQIWRGRRWWPWIAAHFALMAVAATAALFA